MRLTDAHASLLRMQQAVFTTADAAARLGLQNVTASKMLTRLSVAEHLVRLRRGSWAVPGKADALQVAHGLTAPFPAYVSLQTALFHHGLVSQIPDVVYVASPARTQRWNTPLGTFSIHHLQPAFFFIRLDAWAHAVLQRYSARSARPPTQNATGVAPERVGDHG